MTSFDPAAATAAYIAQLPPDVLTKAAAYTHGNEWLLLWDWVAGFVVALIILKSGILIATRNGIQRSRARPLLASFVVGLVYALSDRVLSLPWSVYRNWWRERAFGLSSQSLPSWLTDTAIQSVAFVLILSLLLTGIYFLFRRTGGLAWLWSGGLTAFVILLVLIVEPVFLEPLLNDYQPAPAGPVRDAVSQLAKDAGIPQDRIFIYNGSKQSNRYTANVSGLFGTARIAMSDVMFQKGADLHEVRGVVAHEISHYIHKDGLMLAGAVGIILLFTFWLTGLLFQPVRDLLGATQIESITDPAGIPIIVIIISAVLLICQPLINTVIRVNEARADRYSVEHTQEADGLARALIQTAEYRNPTPTRLEEILFYDHPSVERRIRMLMEWKAAHLSEAR